METPSPIPLRDSSPALAPRRCSNWITAYLEYTERSESPDLFHFWTAVSVIAGALRRRVWIDQRYFQWTPNFYIIFVAPPGVVSKSTTANIGMRLLREVPGIHFGPNSVTWQALTLSLAEATEMVQLGDPAQFESAEFLPMSCITIVSSELGSFLNPQDREMVDVLVDLWDSNIGTWQRKTKTQGDEEIENPWINVIGCTTPGWIKDNVPDYVISGGFASRCVFVYGDKKRHLEAYPAAGIEEKRFAQLREDLVADLTAISALCGEYTIEPDAIEWGRAWYAEHWESIPVHLASEKYGGYRARKQTHLHKLAMVLAAAESADLRITQRHLELAAGFVTSLETEMTKIFEEIGMTEKTRSIQEVIAQVRAHEQIPRRELYRLLCRRMDHQGFENALNSAIHADFISASSEEGQIILRAKRAKGARK